jgi:type I restriction enzyme R subunit
MIEPLAPAPGRRQQGHRWLTQGLAITVMAGNDWLVVNQLEIDVNGLPLAVLELKNPTEEKADIWAAFNQLQTYKSDIPDLFLANVLLVISAGA